MGTFSSFQLSLVRPAIVKERKRQELNRKVAKDAKGFLVASGSRPKRHDRHTMRPKKLSFWSQPPDS